ncbi:MarR family winged helix-turn-helix transcriptional regulator [Lysinibacter cavernae]|uniref:DNA-binding MarR family transcriptional regulator n=1 Tax=Lysinibacter cavernae TaxID=1640652 RepID=A0A7X5R1C8_9MICO|nr:DNA-binding MarR family transcriptional regulator [Lysinibacter cavernae]
MSELEQSELKAVLADLVQTNHRLTRVAAQATGNTDSPAMWRTLSALNGAHPMRLGDLAALSRVAQPTMTKLVSGLVESGQLERIPDPADARASLIGITASGVNNLLRWRSELASALVPLFADLSQAEIATLSGAVQIIRDHIDP